MIALEEEIKLIIAWHLEAMKMFVLLMEVAREVINMVLTEICVNQELYHLTLARWVHQIIQRRHPLNKELKYL